MADQPTGTVTLLFSDIEGSTALLQRLGTERYAQALDLHRALLREAFERHGGYEVDCEGDAFFVSFASASEAVAAAAEAQESLARAEWPGEGAIRVRIGLHTGEPAAVPPKYVGLEVHRAARIMAAAHGGQVLVSQSTRELVGDASLRDLGEHRLKDLTAPERLYQVGDGEFPPLKSLYETNLPVQASPLIGRKRELAEVVALVSANRLVTLTGAGGSGKTRLAVQAAAELVDDYPDGVWFVPLSPLIDPSLVYAAVASVVGAEDLQAFLRERRALLVLDNLEQLLPEVAPLIAELDATVIATSRERLNVLGEQEFPVPLLSLEDGIALFEERARQLVPAFQHDEHAGAICRELDGLPLAIELAAARVKVLPPREILGRLRASLDLLTMGARDAPARQRTLRGTLEWSYDLLTSNEQRLFESLSVFAGGFGLEAAEAVANADLDTVASLVDKSLLRTTDGGRFAMLHVVGEFALERLTLSGDPAALARRHASHYRSVADAAEPALHGGAQRETLERLAADHANIRRAIEWALEGSEWEIALAIAGKLFRYWDVRAPAEGTLLVERALAASPTDPSPERADALFAASFLTQRIGGGDPERRASQAREALSIYGELGNRVGVGRTLSNLAAAQYVTNPTEAKTLWAQALAEAEAGGDHYYVAMVNANLSDVAIRDGDFRTAAILAEKASATCLTNRLETSDVSALALANRAQALARLGDPEATETARAAIKVAAEIQWPFVVCSGLLALAASLRIRDPEDAAVFVGAVESLLGSVEDATLELTEAELYREIQAALTELLGVELFERARAAGHALDYETAVARATQTM